MPFVIVHILQRPVVRDNFGCYRQALGFFLSVGKHSSLVKLVLLPVIFLIGKRGLCELAVYIHMLSLQIVLGGIPLFVLRRLGNGHLKDLLGVTAVNIALCGFYKLHLSLLFSHLKHLR